MKLNTALEAIVYQSTKLDNYVYQIMLHKKYLMIVELLDNIDSGYFKTSGDDEEACEACMYGFINILHIIVKEREKELDETIEEHNIEVKVSEDGLFLVFDKKGASANLREFIKCYKRIAISS